jgi:hypothetical protein
VAHPYKSEAKSSQSAKLSSVGGKAPLQGGPVKDEHGNQDPVDKHAPGYDNDASGWVRGAGGDATTKPGFDHGSRK